MRSYCRASGPGEKPAPGLAQLVRAAAVDLALAALALLAGPYLASAFSGGGFAAALAAQLGRPAARNRA